MAQGMSERQFAKHTGRALSTVQEARRTGRLSKSVSKDARGHIRIDPVLAAEEWSSNTLQRVTEDGGATRDWRAARTKREAALAALAETELGRQRGDLVDAKAMRAKLVDVFTHCRNKLLGIPSRLKQRCPHLTIADMATIDALIREALEDLGRGR